MLLFRLRGTPDTWRPSARTVRYVRRTGLFAFFILGASSLASFAGMAVFLARGAFEALNIGLDTLPPFIGLVVVTGAIGAFTGWLGWDARGNCSHLLELDWDAGQLLTHTLDGIEGAPLVVTPPTHVGLLGPQMKPRWWTMNFADVRALVITRSERRTLMVGRSGRYLGTRVEPIETLVVMPAGIAIYTDRPIFGRVREIADKLSRGLEIPVTSVEPEARVPLPAHLREGTKVRVQLPDRKPMIGYVSGATARAYLVVLAHGESVAVAPFQVTPTL